MTGAESAEFIQPWHTLLVFLISLAGVYRWWVQPTLQFRKDIAVWQAEVNLKLESGNKRFDQMAADIADIKETGHRMNESIVRLTTTIEKSVWRGVGEQT